MHIMARNLSKSYGPTTALAGVDFLAQPGECVVFTGPGAAGKSTMLACLSGVVQPSGGRVQWGQVRPEQISSKQAAIFRRKFFGYLQGSVPLVPELNVRENVALPLLLQGVRAREAERRAGGELERVGMAHMAGRRVHEVSESEAFLVACARALVHRPRVVFADEPTFYLDAARSQEVMQLLSNHAREEGAILLVASNDEAVSTWCERRVQMVDGIIWSDHAEMR